MLFTAHSNSKITSTKEYIESENSRNVENKNETLDIYGDIDIEINNEIDQVNNVPQIDETDQHNEDIVAQKLNQASTATSINLPKANDNIEYLNPDSNNLEKALIIGRVGKATGQNKFWLNIKNFESGNLSSIDFSKIKKWKYLEEVLVNDISDSADIQILDAKMKEKENWKVHKTFQEVANEGQSIISVKWVVTKKNKTKGNIYKARLVARGFEEIEKDNIRKDSLTCCKENFRIILLVIVSFE